MYSSNFRAASAHYPDIQERRRQGVHPRRDCAKDCCHRYLREDPQDQGRGFHQELRRAAR